MPWKISAIDTGPASSSCLGAPEEMTSPLENVSMCEVGMAPKDIKTKMGESYQLDHTNHDSQPSPIKKHSDTLSSRHWKSFLSSLT